MDYHYYHPDTGVTVQAPEMHGHHVKQMSAAQDAAHERKVKREKAIINNVLYVVIAILLMLIGRDLYHVFVLRAKNTVNEKYIKAVRSSTQAWKAGWKMEQIQEQLTHQKRLLAQASTLLTSSLFNTLVHFRSTETPKDKMIHDRMLSTALNELMVHNRSSLVTIACYRNNRIIRVGARDFTDSVPDNCQLATGLSQEVDPSSIFEVVPLSDGKIGLKVFSTGRFVKVVPPFSGRYEDVWRLEVSSPVAGLAEKFAYSKGTLYSELIQGFIYCSEQEPLSSAVEGAVGTLYGDTVEDVEGKADHIFMFNLVSDEQVEKARLLMAMSERIKKKQTDAVEGYLTKTRIKLEYEQYTAQEKLDKEGALIAIVVPVTSKGTSMSQVEESPFFVNTVKSFLQTIDWQTNKFRFMFYVGFDYADPVYDTGDAWSEMRACFAATVKELVPVQSYAKAVKMVGLRLQHFKSRDVGEGAPSQVVSRLAQMAFKQGADYMYQVNDDTQFSSKGWAEIFTSTLAHSPLIVNLGVTGPYDTNNPRILTHSFVHRTHIDIFGTFFPPAFKNWWSDDWISAVYGRMGTFRAHQVTVAHKTRSGKQCKTKPSGTYIDGTVDVLVPAAHSLRVLMVALDGIVQRYGVDKRAQNLLRPEVLQGVLKINAYLRAQGRPPLPLPDICGYSPLVSVLHDYLVDKQEKVKNEKVLDLKGVAANKATTGSVAASKSSGWAVAKAAISSLNLGSYKQHGDQKQDGSSSPVAPYTDRPKLATDLKNRHSHDGSRVNTDSKLNVMEANGSEQGPSGEGVEGYKAKRGPRPSFGAHVAVQ